MTCNIDLLFEQPKPYGQQGMAALLNTTFCASPSWGEQHCLLLRTAA